MVTRKEGEWGEGEIGTGGHQTSGDRWKLDSGDKYAIVYTDTEL